MDNIEQLVKKVVQEVIDTMPKEQRFVVDGNTVLFGPGSQIDSMTLVSVIVDLEGILSEEFKKEIYLTDDRAMTRAQSPFDSVQTLIDYIKESI